METAKVIRTNASSLAVNLVQSQRDFGRNCEKFGIKMTKEMDLAYESGFVAALIIIGIKGENVMRVTEIANNMRKTIKESKKNVPCDCPNCNPEVK